MTTGSLIAIVIGLLILLAIAWFMTRAGRARAEARYEHDARERANDRRRDTVTESLGVATAAGAAPAAVAAHARSAGADDDGAQHFAGVSHEGVASGHGGGGTAATASGGAAAARANGTSGDEAMASTPFNAPDVPIEHTDGHARSQGGGALGGAPAQATAATSDATASASTSFATADVPFEHTDGDARSQGGGADIARPQGHGGGSASDVRAASDDADGPAARVAVAAAATAGAAAVGAAAHAATRDGAGESDPSDPASPPVGDGGAFEASRGEQAIETRADLDAAAGDHLARPADPANGAIDPAARANPPVSETAGTLDRVNAANGHDAATDQRSTGDLPPATPALHADLSVDTGDAGRDVREMIKILNLRAGDASRLGISADEFTGVWEGRADTLDGQRLSALADTLRRMSR